MRQLITAPGQVGEILRGRRKASPARSTRARRQAEHQPEPALHARGRPRGHHPRPAARYRQRSRPRTRPPGQGRRSGSEGGVVAVARPHSRALGSGPTGSGSADGSSRRAGRWSYRTIRRGSCPKEPGPSPCRFRSTSMESAQGRKVGFFFDNLLPDSPRFGRGFGHPFTPQRGPVRPAGGHRARLRWGIQLLPDDETPVGTSIEVTPLSDRDVEALLLGARHRRGQRRRRRTSSGSHCRRPGEDRCSCGTRDDGAAARRHADDAHLQAPARTGRRPPDGPERRRSRTNGSARSSSPGSACQLPRAR